MEEQKEYNKGGKTMDIWKRLSKPPKEVLKKITGGRLSGMTDIKPQWRYKIMTEVFGMCGEGWKYEIVDMQVFDGSENQTIASVCVNLYVKKDGEWSEPVPGIGGSMLVVNESKGPHTNDEAFKMALTDALSVAMSRIGVAAEIYMGNWSGIEYLNRDEYISEEQIATLNDWLESTDTNLDKFCKYMKIQQLDQMPVADYDKAIKLFKKKEAERKGK